MSGYVAMLLLLVSVLFQHWINNQGLKRSSIQLKINDLLSEQTRLVDERLKMLSDHVLGKEDPS